MGSARKAASARRRRTQPLTGLRLAKLPVGALSLPSPRCKDSDITAPSSLPRSARRNRGANTSNRGDGDDEDVAELRPVFAYREIPREMLEGADVDLSTWSVVATDACVARLASRSKSSGRSSSNQVADAVRALSSSSPSRPTALVHLNLAGASQLTDRSAVAIGSAFPPLRRLHLSGACKLTDAGVLHIVSRCRDLRALFLANLPLLGPTALRAAGDLHLPLRELDVSGCMRVPEAALISVVRGCPDLEYVDCSGCPGVSDALLNELARSCRSLRTLRVAHCPQLDDIGLLSLTNGNGGCLEVLDLSRRDLPYKVSDTSLLALGTSFAALRSVALAGCSALTDVGVSWLVERCRGITRLDLTRCAKLSDLAMRAVGKNLPQLESLIVRECARISARGLRHIAHGCPRLAELDLKKLSLLRDDDGQDASASSAFDAKSQEEGWNPSRSLGGFAAVAAMCPRLKSVNLSDCQLVGDRALMALVSVAATALTSSSQLRPSSSTGVLFNSLREIRVSGCARLITSAGVRAVLISYRQLEVLHLDGCVNVDDRAFVSLDQELGSSSDTTRPLLSLRLDGCHRISDATLASLGLFAPQLRDLDLSGCLRVSDTGILALINSSPAMDGVQRRANRPSTLQRLWLRGLPHVTNVAVSWLAAFAPRLLLLDVTACAAVLDASLVAVASNWKFARLHLSGTRSGSPFRGLLPIERATDWLVLEEYGDCWRAATRIQSLFRARQARRRAARLREEALARWVALKLQSAFRGRQARQLVALRRLQHRKEADAALRLQRRFRTRRDARIAAERLRLHQEKAREEAARVVQLASWLSKLRFRLYNTRERLRVVHERQMRATILIQRVWRGHYARAFRVARLRADRRARLSSEYNAVITLQSRFRSRLARKRTNERREALRRLREQEELAARSVQRVWRGRRARKELLELRVTLMRCNSAASKLQRWWRVNQQRRADALLEVARRAKRENEAAVRLQAAWKRRQGALEVRLLRFAREDATRRADEAARRVQRRWRTRKVEAEARQERAYQLEQVIREARKLHTAVAKVQARVRGHYARRKVADLKLVRKKARWKLVEQREGDDGAQRFYYNTETGEVRFRRPQDVLDLLPVPLCDNCELTTEKPSADPADVECYDCDEMFCSACWARVHAGGRRRYHAFRSLFDADGRRVDYAEHEFPSRWPSELHQDDRDGWTLRCVPFRAPQQFVGAWERYVDAASGRVWFFNSLTREDSYDPPTGVAFSTGDGDVGDGRASGTATEWTRYVQDTESGPVYYFYNHRTGESTYERPARWLTPRTGTDLSAATSSGDAVGWGCSDADSGGLYQQQGGGQVGSSKYADYNSEWVEYNGEVSGTNARR